MPRRPKGPRLYLRTGRRHARTGQPIPDVWYIRDGSVERSTGCPADRLGDAEQALAAYLVEKQTRSAPAAYDDPDRPRAPSEVFVAEVLALYVTEKVPKAADPSAVKARVKALTAWWADKRLSDIRRSSCEAYVAHRIIQPIAQAKGPNPRLVTEQGARRELEDLSAAVTYWDGEHKLTVKPKFTLPPKPESPRDALTRGQAARLLMAARGYRLRDELHKSGRPKWERLKDSGPANRAHLRRFILIGLYTGTRPGVIPKLLWQESPTQAWADLNAETIFRRGKRERDHRTKRRPLVKIPPRLLAHMRRWKRLDDKLMARRAKAELPTTNAIIHHGGQALAGRIRTGFEGCVADAGLPPAITPHWMRHTSATWLMQAGVDPWEAAGYLGMNLKTLIDNYGHHQPSHQTAARHALGKKGTFA
jgi:integrase